MIEQRGGADTVSLPVSRSLSQPVAVYLCSFVHGFMGDGCLMEQIDACQPTKEVQRKLRSYLSQGKTNLNVERTRKEAFSLAMPACVLGGERN